jgi:hypothetical protein
MKDMTSLELIEYTDHKNGSKEVVTRAVSLLSFSLCINNVRTYLSLNTQFFLLFFYLVGWDLTPLGPFAGPLGSYKSQHCGHIGLLYIFPG